MAVQDVSVGHPSYDAARVTCPFDGAIGEHDVLDESAMLVLCADNFSEESSKILRPVDADAADGVASAVVVAVEIVVVRPDGRPVAARYGDVRRLLVILASYIAAAVHCRGECPEVGFVPNLVGVPLCAVAVLVPLLPLGVEGLVARGALLDLRHRYAGKFGVVVPAAEVIAVAGGRRQVERRCLYGITGYV